MVMLADSINRGVVQCSQQKVDIDVSPFQLITHGHKKKRKKKRTNKDEQDSKSPSAHPNADQIPSGPPSDAPRNPVAQPDGQGFPTLHPHTGHVRRPLRLECRVRLATRHHGTDGQVLVSACLPATHLSHTFFRTVPD